MKKNTYFISGKRIEILLKKDIRNESKNISVNFLHNKTVTYRKGINLKGEGESIENVIKKIFSPIKNISYNSIELILPDTIKHKIFTNFFDLFFEKMLEVIDNSAINQIRLLFFNSNYFDRFIKRFEPLLVNLTSKTFRNPYPAADVIIEKGEGVVLIYRKNFPQGWAIPGGFINYGESAEQAAIREVKEETGIDVENLKFFGVFSNPERDPRFHTISIVFTGKGKGELKAGDDASRAKIFSKKNLPDNIAFDHREILMQFFKKQKRI